MGVIFESLHSGGQYDSSIQASKSKDSGLLTSSATSCSILGKCLQGPGAPLAFIDLILDSTNFGVNDMFFSLFSSFLINISGSGILSRSSLLKTEDILLGFSFSSKFIQNLSD